MADPQDYTVGWISALAVEHVAAKVFLDAQHAKPSQVTRHDNNDYTLSQIGDHNVVIAVLPDGEYGISSAAAVARDMMHTFPNIRIGLMVGIGGGAPSIKHDIRLGDVVVSAPRGRSSGVVQYDSRKTVQDRSFQPTRVLDQPPTLLRTAISGLRTHYAIEGHEYEKSIGEILRNNPRLRQRYARPEHQTDRLYKHQFVHKGDTGATCDIKCGTSANSLVHRRERTENEDNPAVHHGLIASGNELMADATLRDALIESEGILCFEMEAAGLMNHFPCLVIRGICDYADSHKNDVWQGYAAMVAAVYARDLLRRIASTDVEAQQRIINSMSEFSKLMKDHQGVLKEQVDSQKDAETKRLEQEQQECHQLFRRAKESKDVTYEWYKDRIDERIEDTCLWVLGQGAFQTWLNQDSGLLLISADPGCGKSVLAKFIIDEVLQKSVTICYFFFKEDDQNTIQQALCAILHQLFLVTPSLIRHAIDELKTNGRDMISSSRSLWKIFSNAVQDTECGTVIIVLDALDECLDLELPDLMLNLGYQANGGLLDDSNLKYLMTSRPYDHIISKFSTLSCGNSQLLHIPGEDESDAINQEVNTVIKHRTRRLGESQRLSTRVQAHIDKRLQEVEHRTYLWVSLVFAYLEEECFKKTPLGFDAAIATLPKSVNEAYSRILMKSKSNPVVKEALCFIVAAARPLELEEMNIAVNIDEQSASFDDLDLEDATNFKTTLRSWCGLFVSVHHGKIYLLHQTAREFLLADLSSPPTAPSGLCWHRSLTLKEAHVLLSEACVRYLQFFNDDDGYQKAIESEEDACSQDRGFLDYASTYWGFHFRVAEPGRNDVTLQLAMQLYQDDSRSYATWFPVYWKSLPFLDDRVHGDIEPEGFTGLLLAAQLGHDSIVRILLEDYERTGINSPDIQCCLTPLSWAARAGHDTVCEMLIDHGAELNVQGPNNEQTPLS